MFTILHIFILLELFLLGFSISLNKKPLGNNFCKGCDRCSSGYTGSGVLLYKTKQQKFVLGVDYKNELTDFGGKIDFVSEKIWNTASRELFEESNRVFNISGTQILSCDYIDIDRNIHKYRSYILPIKNFDKKQFYYNKANSLYTTFSFREITDIIEIKKEHLKKLLYNIDDSPEIIPYDISPRLKKILLLYFDN